MIRKLIIPLLFILYSTANAKTTILDNQHPDVCRKQILESSSEYPVILVYKGDGPQKLLALYEKVAKEIQKQSPEQTFFIFDFQNAATNTVQITCLQQIGVIEGPSVMVLHRILSSGQSYYSAPIRANSGENMTKEELMKLVQVSKP